MAQDYHHTTSWVQFSQYHHLRFPSPVDYIMKKMMMRFILLSVSSSTTFCLHFFSPFPSRPFSLKSWKMEKEKRACKQQIKNKVNKHKSIEIIISIPTRQLKSLSSLYVSIKFEMKRKFPQLRRHIQRSVLSSQRRNLFIFPSNFPLNFPVTGFSRFYCVIGKLAHAQNQSRLDTTFPFVQYIEKIYEKTFI